MDLRLLASAYDRSAEGYDQRFRPLQRVKFRAAAELLGPIEPGARCLDAGGGTGLLLEWLQAGDEPGEPGPALRNSLAQGRWIVLDASLGMLRQARRRSATCLCADLARPPLLPRQFALVAAFTALLDEVPRALAALAALVAPGGSLCVSFLAAEAPEPPALFRATGLGLFGVRDAGQDRIFVFRRTQ